MEHDANHIDQLLRQRLHDASAPPPDFVWPRVEAAIRKRRRRLLFFWLWGTGLAVTASLGWWVLAKNKAGHSSLQHLATAGQPADIKVVEKAANVPTVPAEKEQAQMAAPTASSHPTSVFAAPDKVKSAFAVHKTRKTGTPGKAPQPTSDALAGTSNVPAPATSLISDSAPVSIESNHSEAPQSVVSTSDISLLSPSIYPLPLLSTSQPLNLSTPLTTHYSLLTTHHSPSIIRKKETRNCYDFSQHPNVLLADVYAGPSLARKEMLTGPDNQPYLAQRRNTEHRDWSFSAGLRASLLLDRHFLVRTGFHYDQVNEVFEYADPDFVQVIIRQTTQIINGQPVTVIDTLGVEYGEHYQKTYNRYGMLDIPLEVGVEVRNGRYGLSLNSGLSINMLFWKRGAILSPIDGQPAYFTPSSGTVDVFRRNVGVSAIGSVQWFCHLRPRLRVFAEPYARIVLRPVNLPNHPVQQRYAMLGLNFGITRIFD